MRSKIKECNWVLLSLVFLLLFIIIFLITTKPKIDVYYNGEKVDRVIDFDVNNDFNMPIVKSVYLKKDLSKKIKVNGSVNNKKIGEYKIEYTLKEFIYNIRKVIYVNVIDNEKPEIILSGKNPSHTCSQQTYKEEGFESHDNYDGNITDKVTIIQKDNAILYSVKDSSGNTTSIQRELVISDDEAPVIKLKGNKTVYLELNTSYKEEGYSISDNCDSSVTKIDVDNKVDSSKTGVYEIVYTAEDSSGNKSSVKRHVYVYNPNNGANLNGGKKGIVYLTFDDGPSSYTGKILDVLKKYNIKATFFVTNSGSDSLIKREYKEGHTVALHTASHNYKKVYSSVDGYFKDLNSVSNRVYKITGEKPTIIRFPGGSSNTVSKNYSKGIMTILTSEVLNRGYHYFDWNISVEDAGGCANKKTQVLKEECVFNNFKKGLSKKRSNVVLMHDIKSYTAAKLEDMIKYALSQGYSFDKITMDTTQIHHKVNN